MIKILNLGRVLFFTFLPIFLYANVSASLDRVAVLEGDPVVFSISASGNDINFPTLTTVEGFPVLGTSSSSSISIINGSMTRNKTVSYQFIPKYSFVVPVFSVYIDGVENRTEPIKLKVIKPTASKEGDDYQLALNFSKDKLYVGEDLITEMIFKYKVGLNVLDLNLEEFVIKHFVIKPLKQEKPYEENGYVVIKQNFAIFPQLAGKYDIDKQAVSVKTRQPRTNQLIWKKVFSKEKAIEVLALPQGVNIQGDFKITAFIDKNETKANEPVNLNIKLEGFGNIDDVEEFKLHMQDEVVYNSKPEIQTGLQDGKYAGVFTQKVSIIGDKDFVIKPISFKYFDINTKSVKIIKTKAFTVKVKGVKKQAPSIQTGEKNQALKTIQLPPKIIIQKEDAYIKYLFLIAGVFAGIVLMFIINKKNIKEKVSKPLEIRIKKSKSDKDLYTVLLPYSFNEKIITILKALEENIYNKKSNTINKKEILEIIDDENLS